MLKTQLNIYNRGIILPQEFSHIDWALEEYKVGEVHEIYKKFIHLGTAEVVSKREFYYKDLRDNFCYHIFGNSTAIAAHQMCKLLNAGNTIEPDSKFYHVIFQWKIRNIENQGIYLKEFWNDILETTPNEQQ